jgi:hypothetical protein
MIRKFWAEKKEEDHRKSNPLELGRHLKKDNEKEKPLSPWFRRKEEKRNADMLFIMNIGPWE